jgi:dephospho-CoA kinase
MLRVGLTGGTGAGKSTVAARLAARGAAVVDADRLARDVVEPGTPGLAAVVDAFGPAVLDADGALDRAALGRLVFADPAARRRLNELLHPRIAALTAERIAALPPDTIVVHDVPLLVENRLGPNYHLVLVVHADGAERVRRLVADRGLTAEDAAARVAAQADDAARRAAADVWLDNSGPAGAVLAAVDRLWDERLAPYAENLRLRRPASVPERPREPDADTVRRLRERVARVVGTAAEDVHAQAAGGGRVEVVVECRSDDGVRDRLDEAGFVRAPNGMPEELLHLGADPARWVTVHVVAPWAVPGAPGE